MWFVWRDSFGEAEQAADYGGPYVDERLLRSENAVAGIAKPRANVAIFIELTVQGSDIERNFRIFLMEGFDSFRSGDDAEEMNFLHAMLI